MDKISVIMSTYKEPIEWIRRAIESILNQTYKNLEFIIVVDAPTYKELISLLNNYKDMDDRVKVVVNDSNIGLVESLNKALSLCNGSYVARMDADDISYGDRIEKQVNYIKNTNVDFVMGRVNFIDENGLDITNKKSSVLKDDCMLKQCLKYGNVSIHPTWMFKREILNQLVKYNDVSYAEDYDFLCRAIINGYKVKYMDDYLVKYRVRKSGITKSKSAYQEINSQIVSKNYKKALKDSKKYNVKQDIKKIKKKSIEEFLLNHERFQVAKKQIKSKKIIRGTVNAINILIKSKFKRIQVYNYIMKSICLLR